MEETVKKVQVSFDPPPPKKEKTVQTQKEKQKRQITTMNKWNFTDKDREFENQRDLIRQLLDKNVRNQKHCELVFSLIHRKVYGYRTQDVDKNLLCEEKFVDEDHVYRILIECDFKCFYCKENVDVLYEYVRDGKQWTLERLDNDYGHNKDNVVIACLSCNLRRKTMHHERYVFTKQLVITKID
jgi:hypothetical protein